MCGGRQVGVCVRQDRWEFLRGKTGGSVSQGETFVIISLTSKTG